MTLGMFGVKKIFRMLGGGASENCLAKKLSFPLVEDFESNLFNPAQNIQFDLIVLVSQTEIRGQKVW